MNKKIVFVAIIFALIAAVATAFFRGELGVNQNNELAHMEELYAMKDTDITDKVAVGKVVKSANMTEYPLDSVEIWNDAGDERIDVKFKVAGRSEHRYADYTGLNKTAALALSLIPEADAIAFYLFDAYGDVKVLETSFFGSYYDRNLVYEREGMDKFHVEYIDGAAADLDTFKEYYNTTMNITAKDTKSDWQDKMYEFIGDDCEIVTNSGIGADIELNDEFFASEDYEILKGILGEPLDKYAGAGKTMHLQKYDIRNFKTGETRKCAVAYYDEPELGVVMIAQKFLDTEEDVQAIRNQIVKRN